MSKRVIDSRERKMANFSWSFNRLLRKELGPDWRLVVLGFPADEFAAVFKAALAYRPRRRPEYGLGYMQGRGAA